MVLLNKSFFRILKNKISFFLAVIFFLFSPFNVSASDFILNDSQYSVKADVCSIHYVSGNWVYEDESPSKLLYMAYIPDNVTADTTIILYLHGNGEVKSEWYNIFDRYDFVRHIDTNRYIFIFPLERKKCNWNKDIKKLDAVIKEVCEYTGAVSDNNLYIAGVSAGADCISDVASVIDFNGAIYMAGSLKGYNGSLSANDVATLWQGKDIYYFRDNLYKDGGYNYDADFIDELVELSKEGTFGFYTKDLNWVHSHWLVDRVFESDYRIDKNNQQCLGMLDYLFVGNIEYSIGKYKYYFNILADNFKIYGGMLRNLSVNLFRFYPLRMYNIIADGIRD